MGWMNDGSESSRPALGPTQPSIQEVTAILYQGVEQPGHGTDHSHLTGAEAKKI
jgi:hypothetical protein